MSHDDQNRFLSAESDRAFAPSSQTETVIASRSGTCGNALRHDIARRQFAVSYDGRVAAWVDSVPDGSLRLFHSDASLPLPPLSFRRLEIIQVHPKRGVKVWGELDGTCGVWTVVANGPRLCARLDTLDGVMRGPRSEIAFGRLRKVGGMTAYVLGETPILFPSETEIAFDPAGRILALVPLRRGSARSVPWMLTPSVYEERPDSWVGLAMHPLPFLAERARPFIYRGELHALVQNRGAQTILKIGPSCPVGPIGHLGPITAWSTDDLWVSSDGCSAAVLLRHGCPHDPETVRRLYVDGRLVHEGAFFMGRDAFRWSPKGMRFVAHATRPPSHGLEMGERLLVSSEIIPMPSHTTVREFGIDDTGRLAYATHDAAGSRLVAHHRVSGLFSHVWNVRQNKEVVTANALRGDAIIRLVLPYRR